MQGFLTSVVGTADMPAPDPASVPVGRAVMVPVDARAEPPWPGTSGAAVELELEEPASEREDPVWPGREPAAPSELDWPVEPGWPGTTEEDTVLPELDRPVEPGWPGAEEDTVPLSAFRPLGEGCCLDTEGPTEGREVPVGD